MSINPRQQLQNVPSQQSPIPPQLEPLVDPRTQAIQQYMQMRGATPPPDLPSIPMRQVPDALSDMEQGSMEANSNDPNYYFRDMDNNPDHYDHALDDELNMDEPRRPSYVDNRGKPSPNAEYSDEDILAKLAEMLK